MSTGVHCARNLAERGIGLLTAMRCRVWRLAAAATGLCLIYVPVLAQEDVIAFGSCARQFKPLPILDQVVALQPLVFLMIGDNVYADSDDPATIRRAYQMLAARPAFQRLRARIDILATWDDHDYGANDAGREFSARAASERIFHQFFRTPVDHPARRRPGVYRAELLGTPGRRIQVILLDTRYFRGPLQTGAAVAGCPRAPYVPASDDTVPMLGEAQWQWLAAELTRPAQIRIIASSIQVIPDQHCFEKWANLPHERARLLQLIKSSRAGGVIFISGDRHLGELSRLPADVVGYPLYEVTSSGLNSAGYGTGEVNRYRIGGDNVRRDNAGVIRVQWAADPVITLQLINTGGAVIRDWQTQLSELQFDGIDN